MNIEVLPTLEQTGRLIKKSPEESLEYFRNTLMGPFYPMWKAINVPIRGKNPADYDLVKASQMLGLYTGGSVDKAQDGLSLLESFNAADICRTTLEESRKQFINMESKLPDKMIFGLFLGSFDNRDLAELSGGLGGFGGIPGYMQVYILPDLQNLPRLKSAVAHEFHHNVRLSLFPWSSKITLGEYLVLEGLADSFAAFLFGADHLGSWVTSINDDEEEIDYSRQVIGPALNEQGFDTIRGYLYGDRLADMWNLPRTGLSFCAGYAVGYRMVQHFLKKSGMTVVEATQVPGTTIVEESCFFRGQDQHIS